MEEEKVSIIITTYNGENSILNAVNSCLEQSYSNIEIIVVDDNGKESNSQKNTEKILSEYINNKLIKYIPQEINRNASVARNTGVSIATGKYIALLDDDDVFLKDKIFNQVKAFKKLDKEYGIVYCSMIDDMDGTVYEYKATHNGDVLYDLAMMKVSACTSNIMFRKEDFIQIGGFDESFKRHQDWEFLIRMANVKKFHSIEYIGTKKCTQSVIKKINLENTEKYRLKYINLLKKEISRLSNKQQNSILAHEYNEIAKSFFRHKKIKNTLKYIVLGKRPDLFFKDLFIKPFRKIYIKYQQKKNCKVVEEK